MPSQEIIERHRALMGDLVTHWRRWADMAVSVEPPVPYEDDDEPSDDREKVGAEVLGRLVSALGRMDLTTCETPADVDRRVAAHVEATLAKETRPGAVQAARTVLSQLRIPTTLPEPDRPSLTEQEN